MSNLTVMPSKSVGVATIRSGGLPLDVANATRELLVAFPSPNVTSEERTMQLGIYRDALLEFEPEVAVHVLKHLRFHNPRNTPTYTQPPTAQDVFVACRRKREEWATLALGYFIGTTNYVHIGPSSDPRSHQRRWRRSVEELPCSHELGLKLLIEKFDRKKAWDELMFMPKDALDELPDELFPGAPEYTRSEIEDEREWKAYLRSLSDVEWQVRRAILLDDRLRRSNDEDVGPDLTESELMKKARALVDEFQNSRNEITLPGFKKDDPEISLSSEWLGINEFLRAKKMFFPDRSTFASDLLHEHNLRCIPWAELDGGNRRKRASVDLDVDALIVSTTKSLTGNA